MKYILDIFQPPQYVLAPLDRDAIAALINRNFHYAAMGRYAFYHTLKALRITGQILIPAYICQTVLEPIRMLGLIPIFYDLDLRDLNACLDSVNFMASKNRCSALLVASMYGNPADLFEIEAFCRNKGVLLIDDAAQSFGAKLHGQYVGTYGNAGFFSFSPGKPTAGHLGAFFWTENDSYLIPRSQHVLYHYLTYLDYYFNRLHRYRYSSMRLGSFFSLLRLTLGKFVDITNDDISGFEREILGGILSALMKGEFDFRRRWVDEFMSRFDGNPLFRIVKSLRGTPHNHKLVVVFEDAICAGLFINYLKQKGVYAFNGYASLNNDFRYLPNLEKINGKVVEMPIEDVDHKMNYLFDAIAAFIGNLNGYKGNKL